MVLAIHHRKGMATAEKEESSKHKDELLFKQILKKFEHFNMEKK